MIRDRAKNSRFWEEVKTNPAYRPFIEELCVLYEKDCQGQIADISYDDFMDYFRTGNRNRFQVKYDTRRRRVNVCALLSLIYPKKEEYLCNLQNTLWAICNEYSWAIPPHIAKGDLKYRDDCIDLFAAETGFALSEIRFLLGDRLGVLLNRRIHREIEKRIIQPFRDHTYSWEEWENNWQAVCAGSIACTLMYECPSLFYEWKPRLDRCMEAFLAGYRKDGVCREGLAYWQYGFGFYAAYAQRLLEFSEGRINLFADERIKEIAQFPSKVFLEGTVFASFSDGSMTGRIGYGTMFLLREHYGELIAVLPRECYFTCTVNGRWQLHLESIVCFDPKASCAKQNMDVTHYMKESQWFTKKCPYYSFAAKGGSNGEPHNHNDLGSFIFCHKGRQVLVDLGCGEYTRDYFGNRRYDILCNRSGGHSVPFLDGREQAAGVAYTSQMDYDGQDLSIDMTWAYEENCVKKAIRTFSFEENGMILKDSFVYEKATGICPIKERLVTLISPVVETDCVKLEEVSVVYDSRIWSVSVSEGIHQRHNGAGEWVVYFIDFVCHEDVKEFCAEIKITEGT